MRIVSSAALIVTVFVISCWAQNEKRDAAAIAKVKRLSVSRLDPKLRRKPFSTWLRGIVGRSRQISWEVNDCGEQDGSGRQTDFPICVAADVKLIDDTEISILVVVGTHRRGVFGNPEIWLIGVRKKDGAITLINRLGLLPKSLRQNK